MEKIPQEKVEQGEIILVPFPYSDFSNEKIRPALILSNAEFNKNDDVVICAITSVIKDRPYSFVIDGKDTLNRRLHRKSQVRIGTITRMNKSLILERIDKVKSETLGKAFEILRGVF